MNKNNNNVVDLDEFTNFVSKFETGGEKDPATARNKDTGAFGEFQIIKKWHGADVEKMFGVPFEEAMAPRENQVRFFKERLAPQYEKNANKLIATREAKEKNIDKFTMMALMQFGPTNVRNFLVDEDSVPPIVSSQIKKVMNLGEQRKQTIKSQPTKNYVLARSPAGVTEPTVEQDLDLVPMVDPSGKKVKIQKDQIDLAKKEGFTLEQVKDVSSAMDLVPMIDSSGKKVKIQKDQIDLAKKEGFKLETEEPKEEQRQSSIYNLGKSLADFGFSGAKTLVTEKLPDITTALSQGATAGFSDEMIGFIKAAGSKAFSDEELYVLYEKFRDQERKRIELAKERTPVGSFFGELAGGALPAVALAALTKGKYAPKPGMSLSEIAKKGATIGSIEGAIGGLGSSEADLAAAISGDKEQRKSLLMDVAGSTLIGGAIGGALSPAVAYGQRKSPEAKQSLSDAFQKEQAKRQSKVAFEAKAQPNPIDFESDAGKSALVKNQKEFSENLASQIIGTQESLGKMIDDTIEDASIKNLKVDLSDTQDLLERSKMIFGTSAEANRDLLLALNNIPKGKSQIDPIVLRDLQRAVVDRMSSLSPSTSDDTRSALLQLHESLTNKLKSQVPGFEKASDAFKLFKESTTETIVNRGNTLYSGVKSLDRGNVIENVKRISPYSAKGGKSSFDYNVVQDDLRNTIYDDISNLGKIGKASEEAVSTFEALAQRLDDFQKQTGIDIVQMGKGVSKSDAVPDQSAYSLLDPSNLFQRAQKEGDLAGIRQKIHGNDQFYGSSGIVERYNALKRTYATERALGVATRKAREAGEKIKSLKPVVAVKKLSSAPAAQLTQIAQAIKTKFPNQANALLDAIEQKSEYRKNAVIFALSQNPQFRNILPMIYEDISETLTEDDYE